MKAAAAIAEVLMREGVKFLIGYPVNPIIEAAAEADIRTIIVRQERTGLHMADAVIRITSGQKIGVFPMQHGPGSENAFGGVAQAYGDSVPIVVLPGGYSRRITNIPPNFNSFLNYRHLTKWIEKAIMPAARGGPGENPHRCLQGRDPRAAHLRRGAPHGLGPGPEGGGGGRGRAGGRR